ncbi:MAG: hypothetical protein HOC74_37075 [Gemmatimonadetes bacterium]|nr:hypothetical protein [Gemmatimonadota bacterium]
MPRELKLLDDQAMRDFIADGFVSVCADLPAAIYQKIRQRAEEIFATEGNPGNDILPKVPELRQVLEHPAVAGALTSVLGPGYIVHPHRHCHLNPPGSPGQSLHQDSYEADENVRHHRGRWAMGFYYPQDVDESMGPSSVLPASQYYNEGEQAHQQPELPVHGPAGTMTIVHYDLWHRATPNRGEKKRFMIKFLFYRMQEPERPSWNHQGGDWERPTDHDWELPPEGLCRQMWNWYTGGGNGGSETSDAELSAGLNHEAEAERLRTSYALGLQGGKGVAALMERLRWEAAERLESNLERAHTNPSQLDALFGLAVAGKAAVVPLTEALADENWWLRAAAASGLGDMGKRGAEAVPDLVGALQDESEWVRRNATEALGIIGPEASAAVPALGEMLRDPCSRVRHNAASALGRIGSAAARVEGALREALEDEDLYARKLAGIALERLGKSGERGAE